MIGARFAPLLAAGRLCHRWRIAQDAIIADLEAGIQETAELLKRAKSPSARSSLSGRRTQLRGELTRSLQERLNGPIAFNPAGLQRVLEFHRDSVSILLMDPEIVSRSGHPLNEEERDDRDDQRGRVVPLLWATLFVATYNVVALEALWTCYEEAYEATERVFGNDARTGARSDETPANAFLHAYMSCCLEEKVGYLLAKLILDGREKKNDTSANMDLHNNRVGRGIPEPREPGESCFDFVLRMMRSGELVVLRDASGVEYLEPDGQTPRFQFTTPEHLPPAWR